ncbi:hypothetical protein ADK70_31850 [Streptomyces rimosus subsp. pseudoverticillatus]|uniref:hypothetical protein n=1 Tax=Streptomyces rimosus TaxID=1927 RepID=UPI0006B28E69|nr:hypothetical protein [Streptomyces rimosus]KOT79134.1 hypothetical protein ADK70_31850 [Streptomyces rimosus subsp. pseudoverticillatus]
MGALNAMETTFSENAQKWQLLDESGHIPATPSFTELFQHATEAHDLSRDVFRLTGDLAASPHSTTRVGRATLDHLARASTMSAHAASHFSETAEAALRLPHVSSPADQHYLKNRMVIDHAAARAYLRRTSEALRDSAKELNGHLDFHRLAPALSRRESPVPPPPGPSGRHR